MKDHQDLNPEAFQSKVLDEIKYLRTLVKTRDQRQKVLNELESSGVSNADRLIKFVIYRLLDFNLAGMLKKLKKIDELTARARALLKIAEVKRLLCPALRRVEDSLSRLAVRRAETDAAEVAAAITPLLYSSPQAGTDSLPLDPMFFALCAWMIARTGMSVYCFGEEQTEERTATE
jgi:hypothetical protein